MTQAPPTLTGTQFWSRRTSILLLLVGVFLGLASVGYIYSLGQLPWHGGRDAELRATYDTYLDTGVLLIKPTGSGSPGVQAPTPGPLAAAAWDDDPGAYIVASLFGPVTHLSTPYPGLMITEGLLLALALVGLPTAVARIFRSPRAGFAMLAVPPLLWLCNHGALLIGTEYGLSDSITTLPVYALYGITASLAFLSLSMMLLLSTFRLRMPALIAITLVIGILAGFGNLLRSASGFGVAAAVAVLWFLNIAGRRRWAVALAAAVVTVLVAVGVQDGVMAAINVARVEAVGQTIEQLPAAHALWHPVFLGLAYPEPVGGGASPFGVTWSDEWAWDQARAMNPTVVIASQEYDNIVKGFYWAKVSANPLGVVGLYLQKLLYLVAHFGWMFLLIAAGLAASFLSKGKHRRATGAAVAIAVPTLVLGLVPPVLVMPFLYYYSELSAALGLLFCIGVGALAWYLPIRVRRIPRRPLPERIEPELTR